MNGLGRSLEILLVEDNAADVRLVLEALKGSQIRNHISIIDDGKEALDFLHRRGRYPNAVRPDLILLDLNLPKVNGWEILASIKVNLDLKRIPVVVFTGSETEEDIEKCYNLHANCYITKPVELKQFTTIVRAIQKFWFTIVKLPKSQATFPRISKEDRIL